MVVFFNQENKAIFIYVCINSYFNYLYVLFSYFLINIYYVIMILRPFERVFFNTLVDVAVYLVHLPTSVSNRIPSVHHRDYRTCLADLPGHVSQWIDRPLRAVY